MGLAGRVEGGLRGTALVALLDEGPSHTGHGETGPALVDKEGEKSVHEVTTAGPREQAGTSCNDPQLRGASDVTLPVGGRAQALRLPDSDVV